MPKAKHDPTKTPAPGEAHGQEAEQEWDPDAEQIRKDRAKLRTRILNAFAALRELKAGTSAPGDADQDSSGQASPAENPQDLQDDP